jgi:hypothetical protein
VEGYARSAFFFLDSVGTFSIILDLTWVVDKLAKSGANSNALLAARIARVGARAGRLTRITKLLKFLPFFSQNDSSSEKFQANVISGKLGIIISQRIALLIMILIIVVPFLSPKIVDFSATGFLLSINMVAANDSFSSTEWKSVISDFKSFYQHSQSSTLQPVWLRLWNVSPSNCPTDMGDVISGLDNELGTFCTISFRTNSEQAAIRSQNKLIATAVSGQHRNRCAHPEFDYLCYRADSVEALFDGTRLSIEESWFSIGLTLLAIVLLLAFSLTFNTAVSDLIVTPITKIIAKLKASVHAALASSTLLHLDESEFELDETDVLDILVSRLVRLVEISVGSVKRHLLVENGVDIHAKHEWLNAYDDVASSADPKVESIQMIQSIPSFRLSGCSAMPVSREIVDSFDLDILSLSVDDLLPISKYFFEKRNLLSEFKIDADVIDSFLIKVREGYHTEPRYHNWYHGCDVMHTVSRMLEDSFASNYMSDLEIFGLLVASLAHDIGHLGVNNNYLVRSKHELALLHNDRSPLENMHAMKLYEILRDPAANITVHLSEQQWLECRKQILTCILNTDMAFHFDHLKKLEVYDEVHGKEVAFFVQRLEAGEQCPTPESLHLAANRTMLQEAFIHAADLSNPVKPFYVYTKWVERVTDEFFSQGDEEKRRGITVSPMCDRDSTNIPNMQLGFIDFVIAPYFLTLFMIFPTAGFQTLSTNLQSNYSSYSKIRAEDPTVDQSKINENIQKLQMKLSTAFPAPSPLVASNFRPQNTKRASIMFDSRGGGTVPPVTRRESGVFDIRFRRPSASSP